MTRRVQMARGFTLIEVLLVIGILVVLGTVGVIAYSNIQSNADKKATKVMVDQTCDAVKLYYQAVKRYPKTEEGLKALLEVPTEEKEAEMWKSGGGPFLERLPTDPWGTELHYELVATDSSGTLTGPPFHVWSDGPDKATGTDDDIKNWTEAK